MNYQLIKIVLTTMVKDGVITQAECEAIRKKLVKKLKPLIGSLE